MRRLSIICVLILAVTVTARAWTPESDYEAAKDRDLEIFEGHLENVPKDSLYRRGFAQWIFATGELHKAAGYDDNTYLLYTLYIDALKDNLAFEFAYSSDFERTAYMAHITRNLDYIKKYIVWLTGKYPFMGDLIYNCELLSKSLLLNSSTAITRSVLDCGDEEFIDFWQVIANNRRQMEVVEAYIKQATPEIEAKRLSISPADTALIREIELFDYLKTLFVKVNKELHEAEGCMVSEANLRKHIIAPNLTVDWQDVQNRLAAHEAVVEYFTYPSDDNQDVIYGAVVLKKDSEYPVIVPLCREKSVSSCLKSGIRYEDLYERLWNPIVSKLQFIKSVYVVPAGIIHNVPFWGLSNVEGYVCDRYNIHYMLSGCDVVNGDADIIKLETKSILLVGGADYDITPAANSSDVTHPEVIREAGVNHKEIIRSLRGQGFAYLPGTLDEVRNIARILSARQWDADVLSDLAATKINLLDRLMQAPPEVLHISTHGFFIPEPAGDKASNRNIFHLSDNPLQRSGLAFSGANVMWNENYDPTIEDDGILTGLDISRFDLSSTSLVVLSACGTGLGELDNGEGIYGLQRAFRLAGAKSLLVSLWDVTDKYTSEIMTSFYRHIAGGYPEKEAFDMTIKKARNKYPSRPDIWAGFLFIE